MEHKIGEIVILPDGRKAKVVRGACCDCIFRKTHWEKGKCGETDYIGECGDWKRSDCMDIIYQEVKEG